MTAEFRIMRHFVYRDEFQTIAYLHIEDEARLLVELERWAPRLEKGEVLVAVNGPALEMLLRASVTLAQKAKEEDPCKPQT